MTSLSGDNALRRVFVSPSTFCESSSSTEPGFGMGDEGMVVQERVGESAATAQRRVRAASLLL